MTDDAVKARKSRNVILALAIIGFMGLVFLITVVRIQANTKERMDAAPVIDAVAADTLSDEAADE